jgi:peroxiredoxin
MVTTFCLLTCALATAQPADRSEWSLAPNLGRGQELIYTGTFTEKIAGRNTEFVRSYRLETSVFIFGATIRGMDAALLTVLELQPFRPEKNKKDKPRSVRLEMCRITPRGCVETPAGKPLLLPLEGPPTVECGCFVEVPLNRVGRYHVWGANEPGRPPLTWEVVGSEIIHKTRCLKLIGEQKSPDWYHPRADSTAWKRRDTIWLAPAGGIAHRVERSIERREPARPTQTSIVRYELLSHLTYPGDLFRQRQQEIFQAHRFARDAAPLMRRPAQNETQITALLKRIAAYQERQPPIEPYCKAIQHVKLRLEAARRGEVAPESQPEGTTVNYNAPVARLGRPAPDFLSTDYIRRESVCLHRLLGRPVLLVFYKPDSPTAQEVLRFAKEKQRLGVTVLGMVVSDDVAAVKKQHADLRLKFPVLAGDGFKVSYGVNATPRLIVIDSRGIVRAACTGWGSDTSQEVSEELNRWLPGR